MSCAIQRTVLEPELAKFIAGSVRTSSRKTYESAWRSWSVWCEAHEVDSIQSTEVALVHYLWHLFSDRRLAVATLGVHQAAVCSLAFPLGSEMDTSRLLQCFCKVAFLSWPPASIQLSQPGMSGQF